MVVIDPIELRDFAEKLCLSMGAPPKIANTVADSLVTADMKGHSSHGVIRLPLYYSRIQDGIIDPKAFPVIERHDGPTAAVDGEDGFGQYIGRRATDVATELADEYGVSAVGLRNSTHLGRIGEWAERATESEFVFVAFVKGAVPIVAPAGSADRKLSTNPIACGIPTYNVLDFPIILDIATSQVANGKIRKLEVTGEPIPDGWTIDEHGEPVKNASAFESGEGALLPLGGTVSGYKGYGLSMIAELLSCLLGNGPIAGQPGSREQGNSALFVAIDPDVFSSRAILESRIEALVEHIRGATYSTNISAGVAAHKGEGLLPGEPEYLLSADNANGIEIAEQIGERLSQFAIERGIEETIPKPFATN